MRKFWIGLGTVLFAILITLGLQYSVELTSRHVGTLEIGRGGEHMLMGLDEDKEVSLTEDLQKIKFKLSGIVTEPTETATFDILVRDKSGKGTGVVKVYDETNISYQKSVMGLFSLEYKSKSGSFDLEKLNLLSE